MTRSSLLGRLLRDLRSCLHSTLDEQHSRRSVLSLGLSTVAIALATPLSDDAAEDRKLPNGNLRVGIIGAGLAGLTAAYELRRHGIDVTVLEASGTLGGRVRTIHKLFNTEVSSEDGGEFIDSSHTAIRSLCHAFSLPLLDLHEDIVANNLLDCEYIVNGIPYTEAQVSDAFHEASLLVAKDLELCGQFNTFHARKLDQVSLASYVNGLQLPRWLNQLIVNAYEAEYGLPASRQSSLNLIEMIGANAANGFNMFGDSDERYKIKGGSSRLVNALAGTLSGRIQIHKQLIRLSNDRRGVVITEFSDGTKQVWDKVILAIPFSSLRKVNINMPMSELKRSCIRDLSYGNNCKVVLGLRSRPWRKAQSSGYIISNIIQNGWDASQLQTGNQGPGAYTIFLGGAPADLINQGKTREIAEFRARAVNFLDSIFPGSKNQFLPYIRIVRWFNQSTLNGSYPSYGIGQRTKFAGIEAQPVQDVHFAGDHTSLTSQGYMNGAVESGVRVAREVLGLTT